MRKTFFSEKRAEVFKKVLEAQGIKNVQIWYDRDGFGQKIYQVEWRI